MHIIEIIYIVSIFLAITAFVPQLVQLVKTKDAAGFETKSWLTWLATQLVTLVYVISIEAYLMAVVNVLWSGFYAAMVVLILHYQRNPGVKDLIPAPIESTQT